MTEEVIDYSWFMHEGWSAMNHGLFAESAEAFRYASQCDEEDVKIAAAHQGHGIAMRLLGEHLESHVSFGTALLYARQDQALKLRIMRDEALTYMAEGKLQRAYNMAHESFIGLSRFDQDESAASLGAMGRIELQRGHREDALRMFNEADGILNRPDSNQDYQLNNLVWLLKVTNLPQRLAMLPRAIRLIKLTEQRRRTIEVVLLVGGNRLYSFAERFKRSRLRH